MMGPYAGVEYNLTLCPLQSRLQHIYHGQPYARVEFIPQPRSLDLVSVSFCLIYRSYSIPYVGVIGQLAFSPWYDVASPSLPSVRKLSLFLNLYVCVACRAYLRDGGGGGGAKSQDGEKAWFSLVH